MSSNPQPATSQGDSGGSAGQGSGKPNRKPRNRGGGGRGGGGKEKKKATDSDPAKGKQGPTPNSAGNGTASTSTENKKRNNRRRKKVNKDNAQNSGQGQNQGQTQGQGGGQSKKNRNKKKDKQPAQPKVKPPTEEELRIQAEIKAEAERQAALEKIAQEKAKAKAERERRTQELESILRDKITHINSFAEKTLQHRRTRQDMSPESLSKSQSAFRDSKKKLKSDLKKCTAFCKKIKSTPSFDDIVVTSLLKDIDTLNLTRYLEEIANAFLECKLKVGDVGGVVKVCVALHQRYNDFMLDMFLPSTIRIFKGKGNDVDAKQKRVLLRILTEFLLCGVLPETKPVMKIVADAAGAPKADGGGKYAVTDPLMLVAFAKSAGHELVGVFPKDIVENMDYIADQQAQMEEIKIQEKDVVISADSEGNSAEVVGGAEMDASEIEENVGPIVLSASLLSEAKECLERLDGVKEDRAVSEEVCDRFQRHLMGAFNFLSASLVSTHKKLSKMEKRCEQDRLLAGSISEQREKSLQDARKLLESLRKSVEALVEALDESMPELAVEEDEKVEAATGLEVYKGDGHDTNLGPFDDEETRAFYCDIPDLLTTIPPTLLGYTEADIEKMQEANAKKYGSEFNEDEDEDSPITGDEVTANDKDYEENDINPEDQLEHAKPEAETNTENKDTPHYKLMVLIEQELPECNRREKIDELAEKFCTNHGAAKKSRQRLKQAIFLVPRSRLDLIPYFSRLCAILDRVFTDISPLVVKELEQQFHGLTRWKKQQNLDSRIRNAKFIGELTKFRVAPPIVALRALRRCLDDFNGYNVDIACCLLESCGRFLHRTKHTSAKLAQLMDTMVRIRKARHFDERSIELMKSAFYMVQPPQQKEKRNVKILSPIEAYLKDLLLVRLDKSNVSFVSKQILRFSWGDSCIEYGALVVKYMLKTCRKGRYNSISAVASLVANLKKPKPELLARLIDEVLEVFQYILEHPNMRDQQRAIIYAKLLGELYSLTLVSSQAIFDQLYNFINFDHDIPESLREASNKTMEEPTTLSKDLKSPLGITGAIVEDEEMEEVSEEEKDDEEKEEDIAQPQAPVAVSVHSTHDPRVPSTLDPPNAVFRIKLVCTLIDNCTSSLVTASNFSKLENFLAAFQRYLFIKNTLPTDIEFSLLDTFDAIESNLKLVKKENKRATSIVRYQTWLDAHNAVVAAEENEMKNQMRSRNRLLAQAGIVAGSPDDVGVDEDFDDEELLDDASVDDMSVNSMDDENTLENSDGGMSDDDSSDDEDSEEETDEEEDEELPEEEDEGDEVALQEEHMRKLEDEAFERELRMLTMEALEKGKNAARTTTSAKVSDSMPSALQFSKSKKSSHTDASAGSESKPPGMFALSGANGMSLQLIKRGHKGRAETKNLVVPSDTNLAKVAARQDSEAVRERELLKTRVLQYEADSAELSYSGDVYMDQGRLPEVRNRTLRMEDIDREFGRSRTHYGGRGPYRGRGNSGGRGLKRF